MKGIKKSVHLGAKGGESVRLVCSIVSLCMYCGICVEVCPFDALFWSPEYEYSENRIGELLHDKQKLGEWMATVPPREPLEIGAEPGKAAKK